MHSICLEKIVEMETPIEALALTLFLDKYSGKVYCDLVKILGIGYVGHYCSNNEEI